MKNQNLGVKHTPQQSRRSSISTPLAARLGMVFSIATKLGARVTICAALLISSTVASRAADYVWTAAGNGVWQSSANWSSNGVSGVDFPGDLANPNFASDGAYFTNSGTYYVKLTDNVFFGSNFFGNASGTVMQVTLDLGTFQCAPGDTANPLIIGAFNGSTSIVYLASSTVAQGGYNTQAIITLGRNGTGYLILTNGYLTVQANNGLSLGTGGGGHGTLIITGPNSYFNNVRLLTVGSGTNVGGGACSVIISNSASLTVGSSLRIGSGSAGGSTSNQFLMDNAQFSQGAGHAVLGKRGGTQGSYDNIMTIKNGSGIIFNNHSFAVGWSDDDAGPGTGNVFTIMSGCAATNISVLNLRSGNAINLYGGTIGGDFNATSNGQISAEGRFQGFGTIKGSISLVTNGTLIISNTTAALSIQRDFLMTSNSTSVQMALGTAFNTVPVGHNIMLSGKLNLIDGGGFTSTTYPLFTYASNLIYTNNDGSGTTNSFITIGTTPDNSKTYTIDTNTPGEINLIVSGVASLPFQITSITRSGANVTVNWNTKGSVGQTNFLQASPGAGVSRNYPGTFVDIATNIIAGTTATFTDVSGITGATNKYYRVRSPQ